jgi:hypothetical protein
MSPPKKTEPQNGQGVLSNLPRTRPQRASARRAAARTAATKAAAPGAPADPTDGATLARPARKRRSEAGHKPSAVRPGGASAKRQAPKPDPGPPVPRQGFESEGERASGPVHPPGGTELVASAAEIIGELAKAGLSTGERLFKDVLSRLPLS